MVVSISRPKQRTTVDRQGNAGDEIGLVRSQEQGRIGHVPARTHRLRSGTRASRAASTSARGLPHSRARVSTAMGVFMRPGRMALARTPNSAFWQAICSVKAIMPALVVL